MCALLNKPYAYFMMYCIMTSDNIEWHILSDSYGETSDKYECVIFVYIDFISSRWSTLQKLLNITFQSNIILHQNTHTL